MRALRWYRAGAAGVITLFCGLAVACGSPPTAGFVGTNPSPTAQVAEAFRLSFNPPAVMTGGTSVGTAMLTLPAPSGGLVVAMSSSNPAAVIPSSVTVPAGAQSVDFPVSSGAVTVDTDVAIRMSTPNRSASTTFSVWAVLPNFFSFVSDPGDPIGGGQYGRLTPPTSSFISSCRANQVLILVNGPFPVDYSAMFSAPDGQPLRVSAYENTVTFPGVQSPSPGMSIDGPGVGCTGTGRFVVHEVDVAQGGIVRAFWATFEQRCNGFTGSIRGDVRVTNPPGTVTSTPSVTCFR